MVKAVEVGEDLKNVNVVIDMNRRTEGGLVEDTKFWVVRPEVSAGRVSGLETLLSGSYIAAQRGVSKIPARRFKGLSEAPAIPPDAPGLHIELFTDRLGSIQKGSYIFYKNVVSGSVQDYHIEDDGRILIEVFIKPEFASRINSETRFWNSSGVTVKGDLSGFKLQMESLASLVYGGISFATPENRSSAEGVENGHLFKLYADYDAAQYGIPMTLLLDSAEGLVENMTRVVYRGVNVGTVKKIKIDQSDRKVICAEIMLDPSARQILRKGTKFWVVRPSVSINRIDNLETLVKGVYITFKQGDGPYEDTFRVEAPPNSILVPPMGKRFVLESEDAASLSLGAPVMFRKLQVGEVIGFDYDSSGKKVVADFVIYDRYSHLVHKNSVFWNVSGIDFSAKISGVTLKADSLKTIFSGGIAFLTPGKSRKDVSPAPAGTVFKLYEGYDMAVEDVPCLRPSGLSLILKTSSLNSIDVGDPVLFKRIKVGEVTGLRLDDKGDSILVNVFIKPGYRHLVKTSSRFFNISGIEITGGLSNFHVDTGSLESIVTGGISFVTEEEGEEVKQNQRFTLYESMEKMRDARGVAIKIQLPASASIKPGAEISYLGLKVGRVTNLVFSEDMNSVVAEAVLDADAKKFCNTGTAIWVVSPEISLMGIKNLNTLVSGDYLEIVPGEGAVSFNFTARTGEPVMDDATHGLNIILEASGLGSLKKSSPVYYRQVPAGRVTGFEVSPDANQVWIHVNIHPRFVPLIRENTRFWNVSGISVDAGIFSGVQIDTETLEAIVAGGVAFATPGGDDLADEVDCGHHFPIFDKAEDEWLEWQPGINLVNLQNGDL